MARLPWVVVVIALAGLAAEGAMAVAPVVLFEDGFADLRPGLLAGVVGAHTEYHYLPEAAPQGAWAVSAFLSNADSQRAWRVLREGGQAVLAQTWQNPHRHTHPIVVAGDPLWSDITITVRFAPGAGEGQSGLAFRYRNDRCYYFFGVAGDRAVLKLVRHGTGFRQPDERVLAEAPFAWQAGEHLAATVTVKGTGIQARLAGGPTLTAQDSTFPAGRLALTADRPTRYSSVRVTAGPPAAAALAARAAQQAAELRELRAANPAMVVWRKIKTEGFGAGRNLRFGDLDGDGRPELVIGQVVHHGPKDSNSELSCLTALSFDGERLWQIGRPDPWRAMLTNDVAFQIHDLDGDGRAEVVYTMGQQLIVADGRTGETKYQAPTPETPRGTRRPYDRFPRILGDAIFFCDLRGAGRPADIILKDRYQHVWALTDRLAPLWDAACNTGHYPCAADVDGDGKDEVMVGYTLFDHDGTVLWTLDGALQDHADGLAFLSPPRTAGRGAGVGSALPPQQAAPAPPVLLIAASDDGLVFADLAGQVLAHHHLGHVQNPAVANLRPDLPGLEIVTMNFWGNQGIMHFFDAQGKLYHDCEPTQYGSMCLPVNWTGDGREYIVLSPDVREGGMLDGWGRKVVEFPADGHPDMCYAVLDLTGDCRDEVVVWDPYELWVYTQADSPKAGRLYKPTRNPLYNSSNYQATVSREGWREP